MERKLDKQLSNPISFAHKVLNSVLGAGGYGIPESTASGGEKGREIYP